MRLSIHFEQSNNIPFYTITFWKIILLYKRKREIDVGNYLQKDDEKIK